MKKRWRYVVERVLTPGRPAVPTPVVYRRVRALFPPLVASTPSWRERVFFVLQEHRRIVRDGSGCWRYLGPADASSMRDWFRD